MGNARLAGVELGGGLVAELLAALVADQGHGDSAVGQGRGVDSRLLLVGLQLVQRGVLRLFQPIHGSLYCVYIPVSHSHLGTSGLFEIVVGLQGGGGGEGLLYILRTSSQRVRHALYRTPSPGAVLNLKVPCWVVASECVRTTGKRWWWLLLAGWKEQGMEKEKDWHC